MNFNVMEARFPLRAFPLGLSSSVEVWLCTNCVVCAENDMPLFSKGIFYYNLLKSKV